MFTRVTASTDSDCNKAAIEVFQSHGISATITEGSSNKKDYRLHLIVGFSAKSLDESKNWSRKRGKFRNRALTSFQPFKDAKVLLSEFKNSRKQLLKGVDRILGRVSNILGGLDRVLKSNGRSGRKYSQDDAEELRQELVTTLDRSEPFKNALFEKSLPNPKDLTNLKATAVFRERFRVECERKKSEITKSLTSKLRKLQYRRRKAYRTPRCVILATDTDVCGQAVGILQTARELQSELEGQIVELHLHVIEDTWEASPGNSIAVTDVRYFCERIIEAMGDHLFQEPEADQGSLIHVKSSSALKFSERSRLVRVRQFRNEMYEWIRQLPVGTNSRRKIWEYCEKNLESRVNELNFEHQLEVSANDTSIAELPSDLPEKLVLEGLNTVEPKALKRFRRDILQRRYQSRDDVPQATLDMFCKNYSTREHGALDLLKIQNELHKSHPAKDRYLRTMALLLLGGIVPGKDKTAYDQVLRAQRRWERLDARFAKSGSNSFFQLLGGWNYLVSLGENSHYSRREDPFLENNPAIGLMTSPRSKRLHADLFYFIDEICWNPYECQPRKIVAFARHISNLCGADQEQWRIWLGPPVLS